MQFLEPDFIGLVAQSGHIMLFDADISLELIFCLLISTPAFGRTAANNSITAAMMDANRCILSRTIAII